MTKFKTKNEYKISPCGQKHKLCKYNNCNHEAKKEGVCLGHYKIEFDICTSKCKNKALNDGSGKCEKHRGNVDIKLNFQEKIKYKILPSGHKQRLCCVKDCNTCARNGGLCNKHRNISLCEFTNCQNHTTLTKNLCEDHSKTHAKCYICKNILENNKFYKNHYTNCINCYKIKRKPDTKKYTSKNVIKLMIRGCIARDKKKNMECDLTVDYINELLKKQNSKCYYCNNNVNICNGKREFDQLSIDRIDTKKGHIIGNCVISCLFCNHARNDCDISTATTKVIKSYHELLKSKIL